MPRSKPKEPTYTVQVKLVTVVDVEIVANSLEEALGEGKALTMSDIAELRSGVTENDNSIKVLSVFSPEPWGTD